MSKPFRREKPKIHESKVKLALKIRENWEKIDFHRSMYYWHGVFKDPKRKILIDIYFQLYINRVGAKYVRIRYGENGEKFDNSHLTPSDIKTILADFSI